MLSNPEMKHLQGGVNYVFCHCKGNTGEGQEATSCSDCTNICGAGNVQNCNYVVG